MGKETSRGEVPESLSKKFALFKSEVGGDLRGKLEGVSYLQGVDGSGSQDSMKRERKSSDPKGNNKGLRGETLGGFWVRLEIGRGGGLYRGKQ